MRVIALIEDPGVIRRILEHLGLWAPLATSAVRRSVPRVSPGIQSEGKPGRSTSKREEEIEADRRGPGLHRHPYDEVQFVREGRGLWTVNGEEFEAGAGDILVIKAGEIHGFRCIGDAPLVQLDVHLSPRFIQENLP